MRVLVFRASDAAARTIEALLAAGQEPVLAPVTTIVPTGVSLPNQRFDALLATSPNAFGTSRAGSNAASPSPAPDNGDRPGYFHKRPLFVVGRRTAEAARGAGFSDVRIADGDGSSLVALLRLTLPGPARLLYLAGRDRKPETERTLADAGYTVDTIVVYAAEAAVEWTRAVVETLRLGPVDAALHFSRRSAELALSLASRHAVLPRLVGLPNLCLSEDVAQPLRDAGAADLRVAPRPDETSLLTLLPTIGP